MLIWRGHFSFCHRSMFNKFLSLSNHRIRACLKGERINRGAGFGHEIPAEQICYSNEKAIQWAKKTLDGVNGDMKKKALKCLKQIHFAKKKLFPACVLFFLACPPLGSNFHRNNPNRTSIFCPLMRGVRYCCPLFRGLFKGFVLIFSVRSSNFCPLFGGNFQKRRNFQTLLPFYVQD